MIIRGLPALILRSGCGVLFLIFALMLVVGALHFHDVFDGVAAIVIVLLVFLATRDIQRLLLYRLRGPGQQEEPQGPEGKSPTK